ncbi:MAG TPA: DUF3300 domain-containing protein [Casimicrobiaceae bacterium]|nr:DUF3300 domain-containing protein [Casimicrobiaceae bacterium]
MPDPQAVPPPRAGGARAASCGTRLIVAALAVSLALPVWGQGQSLPWTSAPAPAADAKPATAATTPGKTFSQEELDQLLAPVALYPDALLAQVLMASTYPLEIVAAERWLKGNPGLKDKALQDALEKQPWDTAVKSLCVFPQVLTMMSEKIDWTQKLGDAFLAQQKDVIATAQTLRTKAKEQGNLKDTKEQKVVTETVNNTTVIKIEPTNPEVVYVPTYNPTVVYGSWWYPSYPPYYYYPPGYVAGGALLGFTAGVIVGGALWGNVNWGGGDVNIDIDRHNEFNRTNNISNKEWKHNGEHRGAVPYRDQNVARQNGRAPSADAASREQFRGRAEAGQGAIQRGEVSPKSVDARGGSVDRGAAGASARSGGADRSAAGASRSSYGGASANAFDSRGGGAQARDSGSRGASSMSSARSSGNMSSARAGGGGGGGARAGGGGGRGGRR